MNEQTKKYWVIGGLFIAVFVLVTVKNYQAGRQMELLPDDSVVGAGKPVLLELGSDSCTPCKKMIPVLTALHDEQQTFVVSFVDVWKVTDKSKEYGIQVIPTQIFFDAEGNELFRHTGFFAKADILAKWKEFGVEVEPAP